MALEHTPFTPRDINPPPDLKNRVLHRIEGIRESLEWRRRLTGIFLAFGSFLGICVGFLWLRSEAMQSGFLEYSSLFFTDQEVVLSSLGDFAFSLVEAFPLFSALLTSSALFGLLFSLRRIGKKERPSVLHLSL
jgi:hypothetical protein